MLAPWKRSYDKPVSAKSLRLCSTLCNPMDCIACRDPLAKGFSRQEYWNGLPCPLQGIFPNQGLNLSLLYPLHWQAGSLPLVPPGKPRQHIRKQRYYFPDKSLSSQSYGFSSRHVWMWELDYKESWVPKNWCFWIVVLEKTLKSPLDCKQMKPISPKGNQPWIFIGRTDAEADTPTLWPSDAKSRFTGKDPDAGQGWRWEEKAVTEDKKVRQHHQLNGHEPE